MADGHGGARTPEHPAPASGPGRLSQRTDGGPAQKMREMTGLPYGEGTAYETQQRGAAMSATPSVPSGPDIKVQQPSGAAPMPSGPDFAAPTAAPSQPITAGAALGPGGGPELLSLPKTGMEAAPSGIVSSTLRALSGRDNSGVLASLFDTASERGV